MTAHVAELPSATPADAASTGDIYVFYTANQYAVADMWATKYRRKGQKQHRTELIFISLSGAQHTIRNMRARFRDGNMSFASLQSLNPNAPEPGRNGAVSAKGLRGGDFYETKLPPQPDSPALAHLVGIAPPPGHAKKRHGNQQYHAKSVYVFAHTRDEMPQAYYRHLREHTSIPTLPEWTDHIWDLAQNNGLLHKLPSSNNLQAWQCEIDDYLLEPLISDAVANGRLPIP